MDSSPWIRPHITTPMFVHLISIRPRPHNRSRIFSLHPLLSFVRTFVYLDLSLFGLPYPSILYIGHMILSLSPRVRSKIHTPLISIKIQPSLLSTALGIALRAPAIYDVSCESGISEGGGPKMIADRLSSPSVSSGQSSSTPRGRGQLGKYLRAREKRS